MPHPASDRALRRMVIDLAALSAEDLAAILDELDGERRRTVERLLQEFAGMTGRQEPADIDVAPLSPWLARRVIAIEEVYGGMTPHALRRLRECAARLFPQTSPPAPIDLPPPSLLARISASVQRRPAG